MAQLYAACRPAGSLVVRHIQMNSQLQNQLAGIFQAQSAAFFDGINTEIDFTGDWKPDADEILITRGLSEAQALFAEASQNAIALTPLDVNNFQNESIKALFTMIGSGPNRRLLLQSFGPQQILSSKLSFLHDGNVFRKLTEPAFTLGTQLLATVDTAGDVRFKSFSLLRRVFDLGSFYRQATDLELSTFCGHSSLAIADVAAFIAGADEGIRKAVHTVVKVDVLGNHPVTDIEHKAAAIGLSLNINGGRIEVPLDRKGAKAFFSFLLNKVYRGPINNQLFITNSNRPLN
ncbi:hypothetical protein [Acidocella sp. C78]|uniref:hypothetical protein n=1 Tax=Acidocella sp. C78 TaxID=1671486 RepID=UPI00191BC0E1|nr:hypothetical protein [Acidocella sp. C78]